MRREFSVITLRDADGYLVASVPNLPGCHTQAKSLDELMERIREAIELCLEFEDKQQESRLFFRCPASFGRSMSQLPSLTGRQGFEIALR